MPELPDVAGFKQYLDATSLHQPIATVRCYDERLVEGVSKRALQRRLAGGALDGSVQWGKWLFARLDRGGALALHFGMSGQLAYEKQGGDPPEHSRLALEFANGYRLAVLSRRVLGRVRWAEDVETFAAEQELGPHALAEDLDRDRFVELLAGKRGSIKSALMNQSVIAGIGNVYSDEILFQTKIHPARAVSDLDAADLGRLHKAMRRILRVACDKGGDARKAPRNWLLGKRGRDSSCPRCGAGLTGATVGGRTAWFCPRCQIEP